jgi:hypothetical protein
VAGTGALDVDPNEDGEAGTALAIFGFISLTALAFSFQYFVMSEILDVGLIPQSNI